MKRTFDTEIVFLTTLVLREGRENHHFTPLVFACWVQQHTGQLHIIITILCKLRVCSQPKTVWSWDTVPEMDHLIYLLHSSLFSRHRLLATARDGMGLSELLTSPTVSAVINTCH